MIEKIMDIFEKHGQSDNDLTIKLVDEIVKYRKQIQIDRFIMITLTVVILITCSLKKQPIIIPGISNKILDISEIETPVTVMRYYSTIYALETQNYNEKNYLSHMDMVKAMISPNDTSKFDSEYRDFYEGKISKYLMRSEFELKGDMEVDPDKYLVMLYGTRTSYLGNSKAMQYETKMTVHFIKTINGLFINNAEIEEKPQ